MALTGTILQAEGKAGGITQFTNRRWIQWEDDGILDLRANTEGFGCDFVGRFGVATLAPVLEGCEHDTGILTVTREAEAGNGDHVFDCWFVQVEILDLLDDFQRAAVAGACR